MTKFYLLAFSLLSHSNENTAVNFFVAGDETFFLKKETGYDIIGAHFNFAVMILCSVSEKKIGN